MNKLLITIATLVAFALSSVAFADGHSAKVSGLMQRILGAGDDVDGGVSEQFTRFVISADTTIDNGWTVGGSMAIQTAATTGGIYGPSTNNMYITTDMATINIGHTVGAVTALVPAVSGMVPGGGIDAGYQFLFDRGNLASNGVQGREAYYAHNAAKIDIDFPTVNGFTIGLTYTPSMEFTGANAGGRAQAEMTTNHGETAEVAASYTGELDGISYTAGVGILTGNAQSDGVGSAVKPVNNDLSSFSAALKLTMGNMSIGFSGYDDGASWGASTDVDKANANGYNTNIIWVMGNMTIGAGYSHQELTRGTRAQASATTLTAAAASNVRVDNFTYFGVGYDMGGGVNTFVQLSNNDHDDGDHATSEVSPQVLFAGISLGF
jgi:hypothetical protein